MKSIIIYFKYHSHQPTSCSLGWRRRGGGHKLWPRVWAGLGCYQYSEERSRTRPRQRFRCSLNFTLWTNSYDKNETKCRLFRPQVSGRFLCLSQSYTLFGGLGSPWVETSWCWLVEGATRCLLCTSIEEEPGSFLGPCNVTSSWTSKHHPPNSSSSVCLIVTVSVLELISWQFQTELFLSLLTNHMSGKNITWFLLLSPGHRLTGGSSSPTLMTQVLSLSPSTSCSSLMTEARILFR